jgi:opacity protein-like surface antigen
MNKQLLAGAALVAAVTSTPALAQETKHAIGGNDLYAGVALGRTDYQYGPWTKSATPNFKLFGGLHLNDSLAVEVSNTFFNLMDTDIDYTDGGNIDVRAWSVGAAGVFMHKLDSRLCVNARLGAEIYNAEVEFDSESYDTTSLSFFYGVGAIYKVNEELGVNLTWESHSFEIKDSGLSADLDADTLSIGAQFWF